MSETPDRVLSVFVIIMCVCMCAGVLSGKSHFIIILFLQLAPFALEIGKGQASKQQNACRFVVINSRRKTTRMTRPKLLEWGGGDGGGGAPRAIIYMEQLK